jgi:hypothetical protein
MVQLGAVPRGYHAEALFFHDDDIKVIALCSLEDFFVIKYFSNARLMYT